MFTLSASWHRAPTHVHAVGVTRKLPAFSRPRQKGNRAATNPTVWGSKTAHRSHSLCLARERAGWPNHVSFAQKRSHPPCQTRRSHRQPLPHFWMLGGLYASTVAEGQQSLKKNKPPRALCVRKISQSSARPWPQTFVGVTKSHQSPTRPWSQAFLVVKPGHTTTSA